MNEGEYFIRKRIGKHDQPWGVYQLIGGQDIRVTAFTNEQQARLYATAQMMGTK